MLKGHEKFRFIDQNGKNDFFTSVNWKIDDPKTNDCKVFRFEFPDGKEAYIKREHLLSVLFACGEEDTQRKMIPQILTKVHSKETVFGVTATKDIKKGEKINFAAKVDFECPYYREEVIGNLKTK